MFEGSLTGRHFLVTGAGRGLGAALAISLADAGARVILTGRSPDALETIRDAIASRTGRASRTCILDLSEPQRAADSIADLVRAESDVDGLINNAATWQTGRITDHDSAALAAVVTSQVTGALVVTRELAPSLLAAPAADIVTIISNAGLPNVPLYGATAAFHAGKHGQAGLTEGLRQEFAGTNVRVMGLYPPDLDTMTPLDPDWQTSPSRGPDSRVTSRDVVEAALFALTRPRNCTLATIVLDSDTGGLYPDATPRHGDKP